MTRSLLVDVGAGTMDVLLFDDEEQLHYKAVVPSPARTLAKKVASTAGNLIVEGVEMGGGPISRSLIERAKSARVVMSSSAAATIHHDPERVRSHGIEIVTEDEAAAWDEPGFSRIRLGDLDHELLRALVSSFDAPFQFDVVAVCAQDHGVAPAGVSKLDFRHRLMQARLAVSPSPDRMLFPATETPQSFNRWGSLARDAEALPASSRYVMDSGMAAVLGASTDPAAAAQSAYIVLDVATSHTVGAAFEGDALTALFEYHTKDLTTERLDELVVGLAEGELSHERVLQAGGHGAWLRKAVGLDKVTAVIATGPKRQLVEGSRHPIVLGAPLGDNMMTGTAGMLEAVRRHLVW